MIDINEIHTFGTSHTQGGGFEWNDTNNPKKLELLDKFYSHLDIPKKQEFFSWPGQLHQKTGVEVINHGQSGFGDEKIYRSFYKLLEDKNFYNSINKKLFIFEFAQMGRKEYFCNSINDYIILNYWGKNEQGHFHDYKKYDENNLDFAFTNDFYNHNEILNSNELKNKYFNFFKKSWSPHIYQQKISMDAIGFISFLETLSINYLIVNSPFFRLYDMNTYISWGITEKEVEFTNGKGNMLGMVTKEKLTISDETNGAYQDGHAGYQGNNIISDYVIKKINKTYNLIK